MKRGAEKGEFSSQSASRDIESTAMWRSILLVFGMLLSSDLRAAEQHVVLITIDGFPAAMFADPKSSIPHIRKLAAEGASAERMQVSNPSVTWPNHTTLVTGVRPAKHSVLYNGVLTRGGADEPAVVDPKRDKKDLVAVPNLFDLLHQAGFRTGAIDWPCTRNSDSIDDDFPDSPDPLSHTTPPLLKELVAEGILPSDNEKAFSAMNGPARDEVWARAACHVIRTRKPHLLALHLLNTDGIHHRYGPESPASYTAVALADTFVGRVIEAIHSAGIRPDTTVIVTADHGFATATNMILPNVLLRQAGLLQLNSSNQIAKARVQVVPEGGSGMIYLNNSDTREEDGRRVIELFTGKEGISEIVQPDQFAQFGFPSPDKQRSMADFVLAAKPGYGITGTATGDAYVVHAGTQSNVGYHGYLSTYARMDAPFIIVGPRVKRGAKIGAIENVDVAPTIAFILGVSLPSSDGHALSQVFERTDRVEK
jgi:predicted AlkP superfamily pyrophosphatase or phosphodiesterase